MSEAEDNARAAMRRSMDLNGDLVSPGRGHLLTEAECDWVRRAKTADERAAWFWKRARVWSAWAAAVVIFLFSFYDSVKRFWTGH